MLSAISEVLVPAFFLGLLALALALPVELTIPGDQLGWLVNAARTNWGALAALAWLLLLANLWQASAALAQREALDRAHRRLRRLEPEDD